MFKRFVSFFEGDKLDIAAKGFVDCWDERFPEVSGWIDDIVVAGLGGRNGARFVEVRERELETDLCGAVDGDEGDGFLRWDCGGDFGEVFGFGD